MSSYNLTVQQIAAVMALIEGEDDQLREDMIEGETDLHDFVSKILYWIEEDEGTINALAEQIEVRKVRQERAKTRILNRRDMITALMDIAKIDKIALPEATVTKRAGKSKLAVVSDDAVPDDYQVTKKTPDKKAINAAFDDADELPNWLQRMDPQDVLTVRRK